MDAAADPATLLQELDTRRAETLGRLAGLTQAQLDWRPPTGEGEAAWSLGEVFMHLAIDEYYLGDQLGRFWLEGTPPPEGERALPPPPYGIPAGEIRQLFVDTRTRTRNLIETWQTTPNLARRPDGGAAGNWTDWLGAYSAHEVFHQRQMDTLIAQLSGRTSPDVTPSPSPTT